MRDEKKSKKILDMIHKYVKFALVIAILLFMVFIVNHREQFSEYVAKGVPAKTEEKIGISDGETLTQEFTAKSDTIERLEFTVGSNLGDARDGEMELTITDSKGKQIYSIKQTMEKVDGRVMTRGVLTRRKLREKRKWNVFVNQKVERGETYTYTLKAIGVDKDDPMYFYTSDDKGDMFGTLTKNGKAVDQRIYVRYWTTQIDQQAIIMALVLCILLIGIVLVPIRMPEKWNKRLSWVFFLLAPWLAFYMVEKTFYNPISVMNEWAFGGNMIWYYIVFFLMLLIFNRLKYATIAGTLVLYLCGIAEYAVLMFRGTPITPADIYALGTAMDVADHYTLTLDKAAIIATVVFLAICIVAWKFETFKVFQVKKRLIVCVVVALSVVGSVFMSVNTEFLESKHVKVNLWNQKTGYKRSGFVLSFMMNLKYMMGTKPEGYSVETVEKIAQSETATTGKNKNLTQKPNVIVIMNETLSDLNVVNKVKTNKEVFPYLNSLKDNTIKGKMLVSVFGGGTSNSEYEFLTGNSVASLPTGSNAYTQYLKHETPNLTTQLKEQGYQTVAFHPYRADGWNRQKVYPLLGFDDFLCMDDMPTDAKKYRGWYTDEADFDKVIDIYENRDKDSPLFLFNVTIQNHGGYFLKDDNFKEKIKITDEKQQEAANRYMSLMYESDQAYKKLIEYFSNQDEPTIIVTYGDHQPKLGDDFYELLYGKSLDSLSLEELQKKYTVPFYIWANYDIDEAQVDLTSANYLSTLMLEQTNLKLTPYNQYLLELQQEIPAINANGYVTKDGENYKLDKDNKYLDLIKDYQMVQYNSLMDYKNRVESLFSTKEK